MKNQSHRRSNRGKINLLLSVFQNLCGIGYTKAGAQGWARFEKRTTANLFPARTQSSIQQEN